MTPPSTGRPMSFVAGAILASVVLGFALPSTASGECGHYAGSRMEREVLSRLADLDILVTGVGLEDSPIPSVPIRKPCSGATCSEGPSGPNAPTLPSPMTGDHWFCVSALDDLVPLGGSQRDIYEPSPSPLIRPSMPERPPRSLLV